MTPPYRWGFRFRLVGTVIGVTLLCACGAAGQVSELATEASLLIGADRALTRVSAIAGDGSDIYVAQPIEAIIRVFDEEGNLKATIGRDGEGPGEFRFPLDLGFVGDSLWVLDRRLSRISWFHQGQFVESSRFAPSREIRPVTGTTYLSWGTVLGGGALSTRAQIIDVSGQRVLDLGTYSSEDQFVIDLGVVQRSTTQPFGTAPRFAVVDEMPWVAEDRIPEGPADSGLRLVTFDANGDRVAMRVEMPPQRLSEERREETVRFWMENIRSYETRNSLQLGSDAQLRRAIEEALDVPPYLPLASALYGGCGHLTIVRDMADGTQELVQVKGGEVTVRRIFPGRWEPVGMDCEGVFVVVRDSLDVPTVHRVDWN